MRSPIQVDVNPAHTVARVTIPLLGSGTDATSVTALNTLRERILPSTIGKLPGASYAVTGPTANSVDGNASLKHALPIVFAGFTGTSQRTDASRTEFGELLSRSSPRLWRVTMRRMFILVLAMLAAAVASVAAPAAARQTCVHRTYEFGGGVVSLGPNSLAVEIDRTGNHDRRLDGRLAHIKVTAETRITRDGKPIQLSDLVLNEHVAVVADGCRDLDGMALTARSIHAGDRDVSFAGSVVSLGSASLTVEVDRTGNRDEYLAGKRVDLAVNAGTKIYRDGNPIQLSQLVLGEHVRVLAEAIANQFTATVIRAGDRDLALAGSVRSVGSASLTVEVDRGGGLGGKTISLAVDQNTKITRDGKSIQLSDLLVGERVTVSAVAIAGQYTAKTIRAADRDVAFGGSLTAIGSSSLTVEVDRTGRNDGGLGGRTITLAVDQNTKIMRDGKPIQLSELVVGEHVGVTAEAVADQFTAKSVKAGDHDVSFAGTITAVGSSSLTVEVDRTGSNSGGLGGRTLTVAVDSTTQITLNGQPAQLSQLAAGDRAAVTAVGIADSYTARQIHARTPKPKQP